MKNLLLALLFSFSFTVFFAQADSNLTADPGLAPYIKTEAEFPEPVATIEFDILSAFPIGEFNTFYPKRLMMGFGITVLAPLGDKNPIDIGFGLGYYFMSRSKETFNHYTFEDGYYDVESRVSGGMFPFHLVARINPLKTLRFPIQPYFEGLAGFRVFSANQRLETYLHTTESYLENEKDYNLSGSWSYGFGGGLKIKVDKNNLVYINLKATKIMGTPTENMDPKSVVLNDDGTYSYSQFRARTDILRFTFGFHIILE